jgi:glycosyltransferase involved in cell wall biosynthesis
MRVALITEGTYPFVHGGVSVWCDHLIRALPDVEFRVYAIAATAGSRPAWALPPNVASLQVIGLEPTPGGAFGRYPSAQRGAFVAALDMLLTAMMQAGRNGRGGFLDALRALYQAGREVPIDVGLQSPEAYELIRRSWQGRTLPRGLAQFGYPSLSDVLEVSSSLARFLRPLQVVPEADLTHTSANGLGSLTALAGKWRRATPCVITEHGVYLRERYLEGRNVREGERVRAFHLLFFKRLNDAMLQAADLILPVSDFNRRWELQAGADPRRVHTIYNGVDPASFPALIREPDIPTVSWVGRVDPLKDLRTLIDAFALVRLAVPTARLRLFGPTPDGNEAYHEACLQAIARHGMSDAVSFEGHLSHVPEAHQAGHVVVLSSISEGFPFTVLEAMMSGRATVSTDVGGVGEAVGPAGLLVPPRDPERLAEALIRVLTDDALRHRLGRAARERALSMFTLERMTGLYRNAYRAVLGQEAVAPGVPEAAPSSPMQSGGIHVSPVPMRIAGGRR